MTIRTGGNAGPAEPDLWRLRPLRDADCLIALTAMLHRAYRPLLDRGLRYVATSQPPETTERRCGLGECYVATLAEQDSTIIGTVVLIDALRAKGCAWYDRPEVATFEQFAVEPAYQKRGVGRALMNLIEHRAAETGAAELALDTSEHAHHLIEYYAQRGYRLVGETQWPMVNYRSVVMSKSLASIA